MGAKLSSAQKKRLLRDGVLVIPGLVPRPRIEAAMREVNHLLGAGKHPGLDKYSGTLTDYLSERLTTPVLMDLSKGTLRELVNGLLGPSHAVPCSDAQIALRFPSKDDAVPAQLSTHVDWEEGQEFIDPRVAPTGARFRYTVCAGILLSDLPRRDMGNLVVYPGTFRLIASMIKKSGLAAMETGICKSIALPAPVQVTGKAGDVVLFHFQTAHAVAHNTSPHIRYMAYFRFWHVDAWYDNSLTYCKRAMIDPWLEWPGLGGAHEA